MNKINKSVLEDLLQTMLKIRNFELAVEKNFQLGHIYGTAHLAIGQEATPTGSIAALKENDLITSTHRGHGHCIAKGADLKLMMAEIFGRVTGYCKGKGGSMHIADVSGGNLGANGIVGGSAENKEEKLRAAGVIISESTEQIVQIIKDLKHI